MYPMSEPARAGVLRVPGRCLAVLVLVVVESALLHRLGALEESGFLEPEAVRLLVVQVFQEAALEVVSASDVQGPLLTEARQLVDTSVSRGAPFDFGAFHRAPLLRNWH